MSSLLTPLWNNSVKILYQVATQHPQQEGLMVFCQRLLYTLQVSLRSHIELDNNCRKLLQYLKVDESQIESECNQTPGP